MKRFVPAAWAVITSLALLVGCAALNVVSGQENQLAVQYATMKVLERDDVSADRIVGLVAEAKSYVEEGQSVTVAALVGEARDRLRDSSLSPADQLLIEAILARAQERIEARLGEGILPQEQRLQLLTVLNWIESAASGDPFST